MLQYIGNPISKDVDRAALFGTFDHSLRAHPPLGDLFRSSVRRTIMPRHDLYREGDGANCAYLILSGWAVQYRSIPDGRRHVFDFAISGDLCDSSFLRVDEADHSLTSITRVQVTEIGVAQLRHFAASSHDATVALLNEILASRSIARERAFGLAKRNGVQRVAHCLCELFTRLQSVGLTRADTCDFPITQQHIADFIGLTPVHVNRTLQELRRRRLIELSRAQLSIPDLEALKKFAFFDDNYLKPKAPLLRSDLRL